MHSFSRRRFLATAIISALVVACTGNKVEKRVESLSSPTLTKKPTRIVALEWVYAEDLLALGIQPVGVADISSYKQFVNVQPKLADTVVNVGTRQEPSLEAIAKLEPDLILGVELRHEMIYDTLSSIAPTLLFNPYPPPNKFNQLDEMQQTFLAIADAVNRRDAGEGVLQQMRGTFKIAADRLRSADFTGSPFILAHFVPGTPQPRLFTDNAMAVQVLTQIGLENAWQGEIDRFGFNTVGVEALPAVEQANFLYIAEEEDVQWQQFQNNPVWKGLEFIQESRIYPIGADTWVFGGPLSARVLVNNVVAALSNR
ncbi:iron-siderophore ABC transporter substrate-binding protein [Chroococcidiopsis sp. CCMEE 29]|uniref:ABC transporter substrate-binding protein n=1 Tax=Chroococcidiopsis sp. CCMEE 29 TaxID=155894 RepID=UPI002021E399|nr:iron-siderophore ABC transporter substrate-binding protein [Chroococcidiopsis sp. CCMEE 29]